MNDEQHDLQQQKPPYVHLRRAEPKRRPLRILAPLVFAAIAALILYDQVPWVHTTVERVLRPTEYQARTVCQQSALAAAREPRTARLVAAGKVHRTSDALYVERIVIGEMGADAKRPGSATAATSTRRACSSAAHAVHRLLRRRGRRRALKQRRRR